MTKHERLQAFNNSVLNNFSCWRILSPFQGIPDEWTAKVEVLNGCGVAGAASKVATKLKKAGFRIARTDNAPRFNYAQNRIINHKGNIQSVKRLAKLLKCKDIKDGTASEDGVDVTVIVGRNYNR